MAEVIIGKLLAQWWRASAGRACQSAAGADARAEVAIIVTDGKEARFWTPNEGARWRAQTLFTKEPVTIEWLRAMPEGAVFYDVGANVGMYSIFAAVARGATVVALEPESQNYAVLNRNIALNALDRQVTAYCVALSDDGAVSRLYLSAQEPGASSHSFASEVGFDLAPRAAEFHQGSVGMRLDELVRMSGLPQPQYVKVDVDGFEHKVLHGMGDLLRSPGLRSLIVELNPKLPEHLAVRQWLTEFGFRWDPAQVARSTRASGLFEGVAEHVFSR